MCLKISGGLAATPPPGMDCNVSCTVGQQLQADFRRNAALWLKMDEEKKGVVKARSKPQRQRRLVTRLSVSTETLLRLHFDLPISPELSHTLPLRPTEAVRLLRELAAGTPIDELTSEEL